MATSQLQRTTATSEFPERVITSTVLRNISTEDIVEHSKPGSSFYDSS
jgi:hypothetical protein